MAFELALVKVLVKASEELRVWEKVTDSELGVQYWLQRVLA